MIGAHVSTAGGLHKAVGRGEELGCDAIQIFNQSPRSWRSNAYSEEDTDAFVDAMAASRIESVIIHAIYLINCATPEEEKRAKSAAALTDALRLGDAIGAAGVVLHPGARKKAEAEPAIALAGEMIGGAIADSENCPLLIEQMAGGSGILGADLEEVAAIAEAAGGDGRIGLCLDSCHMFAAGFEVNSAEGLDSALDRVDSLLGLDRLAALHINDSAEPFCSRRDRHADLGQGEIGEAGLEVFLSEPRFEGLPATLETPGPERKGPVADDVAHARRLREAGLGAR